MLYSTGANIKLAGKSNFHGAVYASNASIDRVEHMIINEPFDRQSNTVLFHSQTWKVSIPSFSHKGEFGIAV